MATAGETYFGALDLDGLDGVGVVWEREFSLNGENFDVSLWAQPGRQVDTALLDSFAAWLADLATADANARSYLVDYFEQDRWYIDFQTRP